MEGVRAGLSPPTPATAPLPNTSGCLLEKSRCTQYSHRWGAVTPGVITAGARSHPVLSPLGHVDPQFRRRWGTVAPSRITAGARFHPVLSALGHVDPQFRRRWGTVTPSRITAGARFHPVLSPLGHVDPQFRRRWGLVHNPEHLSPSHLDLILPHLGSIWTHHGSILAHLGSIFIPSRLHLEPSYIMVS